MVDYKRSTGTTGQMMIRDTGKAVEFWITSGDPYTYHYDLPWGYTVNGETNNSRKYRYTANSGWRMLGTWNIYDDTTVTFRLMSTGLSAFGGPTTFTANIERATVPVAPWFPTISEITANSMRLRWNDAADNGGAAVVERRVARNTIGSTSGATILGSTGDDVYSGLAPGTQYYWWSATRNAKGWSGWSDMSQARTISVGDAPAQVYLSFPAQTTMVAEMTDGANNGGSPILERQLAVNVQNTLTGITTFPYTETPTIITGLSPATTYYVWGRVRNAAGWSAYSPVTSLHTIAGAYFNVNGVIREAVPYVKHEGVWKLARPWGRQAGVWKQTG